MPQDNRVTLDKALEAAAKVYASQNRREPPTPSDIEGTAEDLRSPINAFLALADLVPRSALLDMEEEYDGARSRLGKSIEGQRVLTTERDEARREARALDAGLDIAGKKIEQEKAAKEKSRRENDALGKQLAALRVLLDSIINAIDDGLLKLTLDFSPPKAGEEKQPLPLGWQHGWINSARAATADTEEAATQFQRVPEGWGVYPNEPSTAMILAGQQPSHPFDSIFLTEGSVAQRYKAMLAAAPKGEAGEETSEEAKLCDPAFPYDDLKRRG